MPTPSADRLRRAAAHPLAVPALMAALVCLIGAQVAGAFEIPSWGNDEAPHLGYVATLSHGELPTIDSPIVDDATRFPPGSDVLLGWDGPHREIWTANHPPLYHALLVPLWWLTSDDLSHAVISMRLVNTLGFGCWVLLVGLIARELIPRRPAVAALASVVAVTPSLALRSGFLMSDGWGSAAALLAMLLTIRMVRGGPPAVTMGRVVATAFAGVLAAGTRAPGVLVVAVCSLTLLVCLRRSRRGVLAALLIGGVPAAATSWFYLRNIRLYGDLTGQQALVEKFQRSPVQSLADVWQVPGLWEPVIAAAIPILVLLVLAPYAAARWLRAGMVPRLRPDPVWTMLAVHAGLTGVNVVGFIRIGGGFHDRYLMTAMPLLATVTAWAMLSARRPEPWARRRDLELADWRATTAWTAVLLVWLAAGLAFLEWQQIFSVHDRQPVEGPVPVLLLVAAAAVGLLVLAVSARLARLPSWSTRSTTWSWWSTSERSTHN